MKIQFLLKNKFSIYKTGFRGENYGKFYFAKIIKKEDWI